MNPTRITPDRIRTLQAREIFVFGSNIRGFHMGGAACYAHEHFGARWGQGIGLQGSSYAIPTMQGDEETIRPFVEEFLRFALQHPELRFLVTEIGCGIAGFRPAQIAPLFAEAERIPNVCLPQSFWNVLNL